MSPINTTSAFKRPVLIAVMTGLIFLSLHAVSAQDNADLFAEVFGSAAPEEDVTLDVAVNGFPAGQVSGITDFSTVRLNGTEIVVLLEEWLRDEEYTRLQGEVDPGEIDSDALTLYGIEITPDLAQLALDVQVPPEMMRVIPFDRRRSFATDPPVEPEFVSGYVNLYSRVFASEERSILSGTVAPSLWIDGTVARAEFGLLRPFDGEYRETEEPFSIDEYQLLRDFPSLQMRVVLGTESPQPPGPFASPRMIGAVVDRTLTMDQDNRLIGQRGYSFTVPEDGTYRVTVNDQVVESRRVPRGSYRLDDLRLQAGLNRVAVDPGQSELVAWSPRLVTVGRHLWYVSGGVYEEDTTRPVASGHWLWGLRDDITVGSVVQGDDGGFSLGATGRTATRIGITEATVGGSVFDATGFAVRADHSVSLPLFPQAPSLSAGVEYRNDQYRVITDEEELTSTRTRIGADGSVGYGFADGPQFSLSTRWRLLYNDTQRTSVTLAGNQRIGESGSFSFRIGPEWQNDTVSWRGAIFVRIFPGRGEVATSVNYDLADGPATVSIYPQGSEGIRRFRWNGQVRGFDNTDGSVESVSARLGYEAYRWEIAATPQAFRDADSVDVRMQSTFQGATALVFAGRSVSISRPVRNSFALFVARDTVAGNRIGIQPVGDDYRAVIGRIPGVVPDLRSYRANVVNLDGTGLPEGLSLGGSTYRFEPVFGAGYRVLVGSEATVYVTGTLVDELNRDVGLAFGVATDADGGEELFFSDETGYFEIHELKPGRYTITVEEGGRQYAAQIDISGESRGLVELGPVVIEEEGVEE